MAEHAWFLPEPAGVPKGLSEGPQQPSTTTYQRPSGAWRAGSPTS